MNLGCVITRKAAPGFNTSLGEKERMSEKNKDFFTATKVMSSTAILENSYYALSSTLTFLAVL